MNGKHMKCEEVLEHLFAYLDGELPVGLAADIEWHMQRCRDCFSRSGFERRLRARLVAAVEAPAPDRLRARVLELLARF